MKGQWVLLFAIGMLLLLWGISDFSNWNSVGKQLLSYYSEAQSIKALVNYSLISCLVKTSLGILLIVVSLSWYGNRRNEK